jgi:LETM1 and EF-hand domain-containing protein 1
MKFIHQYILFCISGRTTSIAFKPHPYYYYGQRISSIDTKRLVLLSSTHIRSFHSSSILFDDKSKIEKTVDLLKDKVDGEKVKSTPPLSTTTAVPVVPPDTTVSTTTTSDQAVVKRKSLWQKIVHELKHYYNGFKLLFIETKIAFRLLRQVLNGHTLTRRERKQVIK